MSRRRSRTPVADRFLSKFTVGAPDECWLWTAARHQNGYGYFGAPPLQYAHRFSFEYFKGPIPEGLLVCHTCDNRRCVNPSHLYAGTYADNSRDAAERSPKLQQKLTDDEVRAIRREYVRGSHDAGTRGLAARYGVNQTSIVRILRGKQRRHVKDNVLLAEVSA